MATCKERSRLYVLQRKLERDADEATLIESFTYSDREKFHK